jgi:hypothetical protein|tara:strand:+ start:188 stop:1174 length:987 start_codon:yes stop_codon:yes gene_type:complete
MRHDKSKEVVDIIEIERTGDADAGVGYKQWIEAQYPSDRVWSDFGDGGNDTGFRLDLLLQDIRMRVPKEVKFGICEEHSGDRVYLYLADQQFAMGWVAYGNYSVGRGGVGGSKYAVWSPHIYNGKFMGDSEKAKLNYNMRISKNLEPILKHIEAFVKPVSAFETADKYFDTFLKKLGQTYRAASNDLNNARGNLGNKGAVIKELIRLHEMGHQFADPELQENVLALVDKNREILEVQTPRYKLTFVRLYVRNEEQLFDVIDIVSPNAVQAHTFSDAELGDETKTYTLDKLPQNLRLKVSTINAMEIGHCVLGVGYRAEQNIFYVCEQL